ncbi:glycosyl hydrolase family 28-related protein [Paraburkholderia bonniea]|uniref:glycosyl hydrolase family 28-related protein n=1 Tax=Paraburkholderia bonniea TaxID=2152891 RepID=UPI002572EA22|nr:glycosyl hydrolase family 28-related protein [Paraburkholderia bonniea]WJF91095.1 glycosyl hydrolase family 28-related protein [Paraburkholderia bonniea]WJF94410.1 glycosyl hydrolase family 28-related protein [Paraburkholderia bonniea]
MPVFACESHLTPRRARAALVAGLFALLAGCGGDSTPFESLVTAPPGQGPGPAPVPDVPTSPEIDDGREPHGHIVLPDNTSIPAINLHLKPLKPVTPEPPVTPDPPVPPVVTPGIGIILKPLPDRGPAGALNVRDLGAKGDCKVDDGPAITAAIALAASQRKPLYFPHGEYCVATRMPLVENVTIMGNPAQLSLLRGTTDTPVVLGATAWGDKTSNLLIQDMGFENIQVGVIGNQTNQVFERNIFFGTKKVDTPHISLGSGVTQAVVRGNLFLRNLQGRGVTGYQTRKALIEANLFGLPDGAAARAHLLPQLPPALAALVTKAAPQLARFPENATQGCFLTGINLYSDNLDSQILNNVILGNNDKTNCTADHVIYAKTSKHLRIVGNFFHGWPNDSGGGVKFKNGEDVVLAANTFDDTGLLMHVFPGLSFMYLKDFYVLNNYYRGRTNLGKWQAGFNMQEYFDETPWGPHHAGKLANGAENIVFAQNRFDIPGVDGALISFLNMDLSTVYASDNKTTAGKPLVLQSNFGQTPLPSMPALPADADQFNFFGKPPQYSLTP